MESRIPFELVLGADILSEMLVLFYFSTKSFSALFYSTGTGTGIPQPYRTGLKMYFMNCDKQ